MGDRLFPVVDLFAHRVEKPVPFFFADIADQCRFPYNILMMLVDIFCKARVPGNKITQHTVVEAD